MPLTMTCEWCGLVLPPREQGLRLMLHVERPNRDAANLYFDKVACLNSKLDQVIAAQTP